MHTDNYLNIFLDNLKGLKYHRDESQISVLISHFIGTYWKTRIVSSSYKMPTHKVG